MIVSNLDVSKVLAGGVLSENGTEMFKAFAKLLCALDSKPDTEKVYTADVLEDAAVKLLELGEVDLSRDVLWAREAQLRITQISLSAYAVNVLAAEYKAAGKSSREFLKAVLGAQNS